MFSMISNKIT